MLGVRRVLEQFDKRLTEHMRSNELAGDDLKRALGEHAVESRTSIKELTDKTDVEFRAVREESRTSTSEVKKALWAVVMMMLTALVASYLASHGFKEPLVDPNAPIVRSIERLDDTLQRMQNDRLPRVGP